MGMVDKIVSPDRLMEEVKALAVSLSERPPIAVKWVLEAMATGLYEGMGRGLEVEAEGSVAVRNTKDREEGFRAFLEKRKPVFKGE